MKILCTGGCGFLGSVLVDRLMTEVQNPKFNGVESVVHVIDNLNYGCHSLACYVEKPYFRLYEGSILDMRFLSKVFKETSYDCVVHLAAFVGDSLCNAQPKLAERTNVEGTRNLLKVAKSNGVPLFVFASTCSVYGTRTDLMAETSEVAPISIYGKTKAEAERWVMDYPNYIIFRNATLFGYSPRMRFDVIPNSWVRDSVLNRPVEVYSPISDIRPFLHVDDCAEFYLRAIKCANHLKRKQIFNCGGFNLSKIDLAKSVKKVFPQTHITIVGDNPDKRSYKVDFSKVQREFNYTPRISVYDGLERLEASLPRLGNLDSPMYDNVKGMRT